MVDTPNQTRLLRWILVSSCCFGLSATNAYSLDWSQFRGPAGNGVLQKNALPTEWDASKNLAWSVEVPGAGWSSPLVIGDQIFLTTSVSTQLGAPKGFGGGVAAMREFSKATAPQTPISFQLKCLRLSDGQEVWSQVVDERKPAYPIHPSNTYATESPASDGELVFVYFGATGVVAAFDLSGTEIWKRELGAFPTGNNFGSGSSLALHDSLLFVQCDNDKQSFVMALNTENGETVWKADRPGRTSWSSPVIWKNDEREELILCGSDQVKSYNPSTGEENWSVSGIGGSFTASPAMDRQRIYFGNSGPGSRGPLIAVATGAKGDLSLGRTENSEGIAWKKNTSGPGMPSPVASNGRLYVVSRGILTCHDCASGERLYTERLPGAKSVAASLWLVDSRLFILDENGTTFVVNTRGKFELAAKNKLEGLYWSTPSLVSDALLLRSSTHLHCIRQPGE